MRSILKTATPSRRRTLPLSLAAAVAVVLAGQNAGADTLIWQGGGTWDTSTANWQNQTTSTIVPWTNSPVNSAVFSGVGTVGTVTLSAPVTVGNITFNTAGYTIAGGTLTLSNTTIDGTANATISANLAGTGLKITNTHTSYNGSTVGGILLTGNNTYSGTTTIGSGTATTTPASLLRLGSVQALGNSTDIRVGGGSSLMVAVPNSESTVVGAGKTVTIYGAGVASFGALRGADNSSNTWAGNVVIGVGGSRISGGNNGTLTVTGVISEAAANSSMLFSRNTNATTVLAAQNTYTSDTIIFNNTAGSTATVRLAVDNAINAKSRLSALSNVATAAEVLDLNGHVLTLRALDTSATTTAASSANLIVRNDKALTASTLTLSDTSGTATFGGSIRDGAGIMSLVKSGANTQVLAGSNSYTGSTTVNSGTLQLGATTPTTGNIHFTGSNGSLASTSFILNGGTFAVDNVGVTNNNNARIADTATFTLNGGTFVYRGSNQTATNSSETIGNITLGRGLSTLTATYGGTNTAVLNTGTITRGTGGGIALVNGAGLGSNSAGSASVARIIPGAAPTLVGTTDALATGINAATQNTKIVPYLLGEATTTTGGVGTATGTPNTFVTYNPTTGLRPLNPTDEFVNNSIVAGANTRFTDTFTASSSATINSLIFSAPANTSISLGTQTLTNASGAVLFTANNNLNGGTLEFGSTEAIFTVNSGAVGVVGTKLTGTNGLSFYGPGTLGLGSGQSTYSGETFLHSGTLAATVSSTGPAGAPTSGPFGQSTVVFAGASIRNSTSATSDTTIGNALRFQADTTFAAGATRITFSGPATLEGGTRTFTNSTTNGLTFSGVIGDGGQGHGLTLTGTGAMVLTGKNTYSGPTTIKSGTVDVTGTIHGSSSVAVNNSGTLILTGDAPADIAAGRIADNARVTLGGGEGSGDAVFQVNNSDATARIQETMGALTLTSNAILDFGTGISGTLLYFADSSINNPWSGMLKIYNWTGTKGVGFGTDQLFFGNGTATQTGLTSQQLSQIVFYSDAGTTSMGSGMMLSSGELVPVPEPSTIFCGVAMVGLLGWRERRRISQMLGRRA